MEIGIIGAIIAAVSLPYLWSLYYKQEHLQERTKFHEESTAYLKSDRGRNP